MRMTIRFGLVTLLALLWLAPGLDPTMAQSNPQDKRKTEQPPADETIKIDTNLVTVPVIASDRRNLYVPDLKREEFTVAEDGVAQEIVFFSAIKEPFQVVLMLDTSSSTLEKLGQIQQAANHFVSQLQPADRVKVISFDDEVREQSDFTSDRKDLRLAINRARPGQGTKLYDAVKVALNSLTRVQGRKAIVLFTDGVDWQSDSTSANDNLNVVEESGVIVYPIRYDTRADTEEMLRNQQETLGETDLGTIFGGPNSRSRRGTTPPTVPGGGGTPVPSGRTGRDDPYRIPIPNIPLPLPGRRYPDDRYPGGGGAGRFPDDRYPGGGGTGRFPDDRFPRDSRNDRFPDDRSPGGGGYPGTSRRGNDNISVLLDRLYRDGEDYLRQMAERSGGKLMRADLINDVPAAFALIAEELRHQYSLGYYPTNPNRDGKYRKIQVKVKRPETVVRARPGYRAPKK